MHATMNTHEVRERILKEGAISLSQAGRLPQVNRDKDAKRWGSTLFRWIFTGIEGVTLEAYCIPGTGWRTSEAAVNRFLDRVEQTKRQRITAGIEAKRAEKPAMPRSRATQRTRKRLSKLGV